MNEEEIAKKREAEEIAKRHANFIGINLAIFLAGIAGIALNYNQNGWLIFFVGMATYGFSRFAFYLILVWNGAAVSQVEPHTTGRIGQEPPQDEEDEEPSARQLERVELAASPGRFYHLGARQVQLPDTVKHQHLNTIATARSRGRLPDVTENKLNKIGISRFALPPNAKTTMEFLQGQGLVDRNGQWTEVGERCFPSPIGVNR